MKRAVGVFAILVAILVVLINLKIRAQEEALSGPLSGSGVVEAEGVDVSARMLARVVEAVAEGEEVEEGQVLLTLDCAEPNAAILELNARLGVAQAQARAASSAAMAAAGQRGAARASVSAALARQRALSTQSQAASREATRVETMGAYAAQAQQDQARSAASGLEEQVRSARAARSASRHQATAAGAQAQAAVEQAAAATSGIAVIESLIHRAQLAQAECRILAPRAGILERSYFEVGELVSPGQVVARIIDPGVVRATFYVPNVEVAQVQVGSRLVAEADALPGQRFEATVIRLGLEAEFTPRNVQTRSDRDRLVFPAEVRIDNPEHLLRSGMPLTMTMQGAGGS